MEQHYKSFMNRQHPSKELIADTVSQVKRSSEKGKTGKSGDRNIGKTEAVKRNIGRWQYCLTAFAIVLLVAGGVWYQKTRIVYFDLAKEVLSDSEHAAKDNQVETFGDVRNSYLGLMDSDYYIFDGEAEQSELVTGQGEVIIRVGAVKNGGYQPLYQMKPQKIKGTEIYLGKEELDGEVIFFAAFALQDKYYYLEGQHVSEREMTACIKELLRGIKKAEK